MADTDKMVEQLSGLTVLEIAQQTLSRRRRAGGPKKIVQLA